MKTTRYAAPLLAFAIPLTAPSFSRAAENDLSEIKAEVAKQHDEAVRR